jgi:O-antigen ligase
MAISFYMIFRPLIQPFSWLQYTFYGFPVALPLSLAVFALGVVLPIIKRHWSLSVAKGNVFIIFLLIAILSIGFTEYIGESIHILAKLLTVWFLYNIAFNSVRKINDAVFVINSIIIASLIPLIFGFYQAVTGRYDIIYDAEVDRISSVFATGNDYGIFLSLVTGAILVRFGLPTTRLINYMLTFVLLLIMVSQVLSLNRGTWLALSVGFIVAAVKYRSYLNFKLILPISFVFFVVFAGTIYERFNELTNPKEVHFHGTSTLEGRINYWKKTLPLIIEKPIIGHGIGSNANITEKHFGKSHKPHNDYILVSIEMGILGLLTYLIFLGRIFFYSLTYRQWHQKWQLNFAMLMLSTYFIVISSAQNIIYSIVNFPIFLVIIAIVVKLNKILLYEEKVKNNL